MKKNKARKVGIWGFYGYDNVGDDLIMESMLTYVDEYRKPDSKILVFTHSTPPNHTDTSKQPIYYVTRDPVSLLKYCMKLDVLIIGAGGLFPHKDYKKLLYFLSLAGIMKMRRKKFALVGLGIGCGNLSKPVGRLLVHGILRLSDQAVLRQNIKKQVPAWVLKNTKTQSSCDIIFAHHAIEKEPIIPSNKNYAVVALANIFESGSSAEKDTFIRDMAYIVKHLISLGLQVLLVPFTNTRDQNLNDILKKLIDSDHCISIAYENDLMKTVGYMANAELVIAMRFHAAVLAVRYQIPLYGIAYSDKMDDLINLVGFHDSYQRFCINDKQYYREKIPFSSQAAVDQINYILQNKRSYVCDTSTLETIQSLADCSEGAIRALLK